MGSSNQTFHYGVVNLLGPRALGSGREWHSHFTYVQLNLSFVDGSTGTRPPGVDTHTASAGEWQVMTSLPLRGHDMASVCRTLAHTHRTDSPASAFVL